jgi:glycosyltransferase involved in cell wall biosynthesis
MTESLDFPKYMFPETNKQTHISSPNALFPNILFISTKLIADYIADNGITFKNMLVYNLKETKSDVQDHIIYTIVNKVNTSNISVIFFLYNCIFIDKIVTAKRKRIIPNVKIIAWHQKHYFSASVVPDVFAIIEYSKIQATQTSYTDYKNINKYIYMPYPAIISNNYPILFDKLPEDRKNRYSGKFILVGGNNNRNHKIVLKIAHKCPQYTFITLTNNLSRICKYTAKKSKPDNYIYYTDTKDVEFAYAVSKCHILFMPFSKAHGTTGHSVVALAIYFNKPVITSRMCSMEDSITNDCNGYMTNVDDIENNIIHIDNLMTDEKLYNKIVSQTTKISYQRHFKFYLNFIQNLINQAINSNTNTNTK